MRIVIDKDTSMYDFFKSCGKSSFRTKLIGLLRKITYEHYYIKFPVTSYNTAKKTPFYIDVKEAPSMLTREGINNDTETFDFQRCSTTTKSIGFLSKTKRSYLVVPCPHSKTHMDSGHIAQFMRYAKLKYIHSFWKEIGDTFFNYFKKYRNKSFQLLTHGHDVYWLHAKFTFV